MYNDYFDAVSICGPCLSGLVRQIAEMSSQDASMVNKAVALGEMIIQKSFRHGKTPASVATEFARAIKDLTGVEDAFEEQKKTEIEVAKKALARLSTKGDLESLIELAVLGNTVDYFKSAERVAKELQEPVDFAIDERVAFAEALSATVDSGQELFYLADNAAELIFDLPLLTHIYEKGVQAVLVLKGGAVQNDATRRDLALLDGGALPFEVVDNGTDAVGTDPKECDPGFWNRLQKAGLIIAKGMANYETLRRVQTPPLLFLLLAKCPVNAHLLGVLEGRAVAWFRGAFD